MPRSPAAASPRLASLALPAVLAVVLVLGLILLVPDGAIVDCERDGHFQRAGQLSCGVVGPNAPYGPLLPWLALPWIPLWGTPYLATRFVSLLALLGMVALAWRACRVLGAGRGAAALAGLLVGLNGTTLFYGSMACSDLPAAALLVAALWWALRATREPPRPALCAALAGAALAGACLVRVQYYLPAAALLVTMPLVLRRLRPSLALALGFGLPVLGALAVGWARYDSLGDALDMHLGLAAYTRNLTRASTILSDGGGEVVPLSDRLLWSVRLVLRTTAVLPLVGLLGATVLALSRRRWRGLLVVLVPAGVLYAGLAWSHPPPDWGARRFYLFLVPLAAVATVLLGRWACARWLPRWGFASPLGALLLLVLALGHGLWDLKTFRVPEPSSLLQVEDGLRPGLSSGYERDVVRSAAGLIAGLDACAAVATNFHPAAIPVRNAVFLGDVDPDDPGWVEALPAGEGRERWLLFVDPERGSPELRPVPGSSAPGPGLGEEP